VTSFLGPAALAVFSRPMALIRHLNTFMSKFVFILTPTAGSLQGSGQMDELRRLLIESTRYGVALTLPAVFILSIYGDVLLQIWMGPRYAHGALMALLAAGSFLAISQRSVNTIMIGMNLHGKIAIMSLIMNLILFGLGIIIVNEVGWSLLWAAFIFIGPTVVVNGLVIPVYTCYRIGVPIAEYFMRALLFPSACALPFGICLITGRLLLPNNVLSSFLWGGTGGLLLLGAIYWRYLLPARLRSKLLGAVSSALLKSKSLLFNS
jgi:O-antigen/teichoic acid export membrane protein